MKRGKETNSYIRTPSKTFASELETASTKPHSCKLMSSLFSPEEVARTDLARRAQVPDY